VKKSIKVHPKKRRGRPATGKDPLISARLPPPLVAEVEAWAGANNVTRSESIRRLVELGLTVSTNHRRQAPDGRAARAKELASKTIDAFTVGTSDDEKASRKRRLIKGPEEFSGLRVDHSEKK